MHFAKFAAAAAAALAFLPASALAQDEAPAAQAAASVTINQGANVTGNDGNPVGTVAEVDGQAVLVDTGLYQIPLPRDAFGEDETGLTLNITKPELEKSYAEQVAVREAELAARLVAGTPVMSADQLPLGTIDTVNEGDVVLAIGEQRLALGKDAFEVDPDGTLMVRATKAQIDEAMHSAAGHGEG